MLKPSLIESNVLPDCTSLQGYPPSSPPSPAWWPRRQEWRQQAETQGVRRGLQLNYMLVVPSTIGLNNTHICELLIKIFYPMTPERHSDSRYLIRSNVLIMLRFTADFFFTFQLIFKNSLIFFCKTCNNYDKCLIY